MRDVLRIQKDTMIPMDTFLIAVRLFKDHAETPAGEHFKDGNLSKERLGRIMRQMAKLEANLEEDMLHEAFSRADKDADGLLSFKEFAIWFSSHGFQEEFNVDEEEQWKRRMSRTLGIPLVDLDMYKRNFDKFDADGSGTIDREEFYDMLLKCLKLPKRIGMPSKRVQQLWLAADADKSGDVDFEEFVVFYYKYFSMEDGNDGIEQYYSRGSLSNLC
jgi:Ca2+-binding EF-hand superfamily protein